MSDFRRFYGYGLEHVLHLEEIERSASKSVTLSVKPEKKFTAIRRRLAGALIMLAERIHATNASRGDKVVQGIS
jgi:hypothetical protein